MRVTSIQRAEGSPSVASDLFATSAGPVLSADQVSAILARIDGHLAEGLGFAPLHQPFVPLSEKLATMGFTGNKARRMAISSSLLASAGGAPMVGSLFLSQRAWRYR